MGANVARWRKVLAGVDGLGDQRRDVAKLQVLFVAEVRQQGLGWWRNRGILMAWLAHRGQRQIVIFGARAVRNGCVAVRAVRLQFQMEAMGKWRRRSQRRKTEKRAGTNACAVHRPL